MIELRALILSLAFVGGLLLTGAVLFGAVLLWLHRRYRIAVLWGEPACDVCGEPVDYARQVGCPIGSPQCRTV